MDSVLSRTFSVLRFPLIVMVVFIHIFGGGIVVNGILIGEGDKAVYDFIGQMFSGGLCRLAVPTFFFMSGYLFFSSTQFNTEVYLGKIKKRFKTLIVPYLFWNIWMMLFMLFYQTVGNKVGFTFTGKMIADYSLVDFVKCFWNIGSDFYPLCFQLWFLRDLILVSLLTPLFYWLIVRFRHWFVLLLAVLYVIDCNWHTFPGVCAVFYFCLGSAYRLCAWKWVDGFRSIVSRTSWLFLVLFPATFVFTDYSFCLFSNIFGVVFLLNLVYWLVGRNSSPGWTEKHLTRLSGASFFVYCFHEPIQGLIKKVVYMLMQPSSDGMLVVTYFLCPIVVITLGVVCYNFLNKHFPRILKFVNGR